MSEEPDPIEEIRQSVEILMWCVAALLGFAIGDALAQIAAGLGRFFAS